MVNTQLSIIMAEQKQTSVETVLKLLRTITNRPEQPDREARRKSEQPLRRTIAKYPTSHDASQSKQNKKRKVDENTVLRRILDGLQPTMEEFYKNEREPYEKTGKSSTTRLNIYLKQNERILKTFLRKEENMKKELTKMMVQYEETLEREYFFTVKDSFRDEIELFITKNRVSKHNYSTVEFNSVLIVLADGQIKIYKDKTGSRLFKTIKLFEFENVEYNDQPFIFMVISFVKDKSKPLEYLYLKFHNQQSQQKWDRILYINFRLKDLKRKQYMFLAEYKEEEQETRKIVSDNKPYEVNINQVLKVLTSPGIMSPSPPPSVPEDQTSRESESNRTLQRKNTMSPFQRKPTSNFLEPSQKQASSDVSPLISDRLLSSLRSKPLLSPRAANGSRQPSVILELPNDQFEHSNIEPSQHFEIRRMESQLENINDINRGVVDDKPLESERIKKSKLETIQEKLKEGIPVEKQNFFKNSKKKILVKSDGFEYVDLEKFEKGSIKDTERKKVLTSQISKVLCHDDGKMEVHYGADKKIVIKGELQMFKQWVKLKMME